MTATNHMLTGAVILAATGKPLIAIPLAFLSHFAVDVLPHFGVMESDTPERNAHPLFKAVLKTDIIMAVAALIVVPILMHDVFAWWIVMLTMLVAWMPDLVWIGHFWHDRQGHERRPPIWLTRFHQSIQWFEKPPGMIVELLWFAGMSWILTAYLQ